MKHKHHDIIVAWAADTSRVVQYFDKHDHEWVDIQPSSWDPNRLYRFKPEPKPDEVRFCQIELSSTGSLYYPKPDPSRHNLRLVFNGETRELKSAEVLS